MQKSDPADVYNDNQSKTLNEEGEKEIKWHLTELTLSPQSILQSRLS